MHAATLALCDRLLGRELDRLEHETPGITAAIRQIIGKQQFELATSGLDNEALAVPFTTVDVARLRAFVDELELATQVLGWR